ncbi:MAG: adenylate/guanylate cyclase domain-containing protein [Reyranella sp.]|nr:adenylate/guanylate cyclase domain-containing protein [Reyranella sp.]
MDDAELKQITVLFADVSGSTELIEDLDPEEAAKRLAPAIQAMQEAVRRFEGSVVKVQGDGIMALFGAPHPQEDHAVRACCAGLALQESVKVLPGEKLPIRVGIHSGEVLARTVTTDISKEFDATGITVHIANRLESLAPAGGIAISSSTMRGARQFISVESLGLQSVRGLSTPLEVFLLIGLRRGPTSQRFNAEDSRSGFVGRERELNLLERGLERATEGDGCAIGLVAEAGVGKSRLCFEFAQHCRAAGVRVLEGRALAHSRATPFEPVIDVLKALFEIASDDTPARAREKIAAVFQRLDPELAAELPLLADFLGLADASAVHEKLDPGARRERLNALLRRLARMASRDTPAVLLFEDLHFLDSGSESLLEVLAETLAGTHILLLVNFRPGYAAPWMRLEHYEQISLTPLRQTAADSLARHLLGDHASMAALLPLIADRARGNPFFIEELVRKFDESGHLAGNPGTYRLLRTPDMKLIPDNVQAIVSARVDSRPELERTLLQTAAVIGREFVAPVLEHVTNIAANLVATALHHLSAAGLVYETGGQGAGSFAFKHPMVQEVIYRSLVSDRRRALHGSVATELEKTLPDPNGAQAGFIAYHLEEAGNAPMAASYNMKAATWHGTRDPEQALDAWKRVRRLLVGLNLEGPARYPLLMASGQIVNFAWREGLTAADVEPYYVEALGIARSLGDMRAITLVTAAYARSLASSGSATDYLAKVNEALSLLDPQKHAGLYVVLTTIRCHAHWLAGDLRSALADNDIALAGADEVEELDQQTLGFRVLTWIKGMRSKILAMMGRFDEAQALAVELIEGDEVTVDAMHRVLAHGTMTDIAWGRSDTAAAAHYAAAAQRIAEKSGNPYLVVYGRAFQGLGQAVCGELSAATTTIGEALRFARERHAGMENEARMLGDLAHVQLMAGLVDRAQATAEEAAAVARSRGSKIWLAYAEWVIGGPTNPAFKRLLEETGAALLSGLPHPRS